MKIGIIGGSGLDNPQLIQNYSEQELDTPFGKPSSVLTMGKIGDNDVVILARHNKDHSIMPTKVPYCANLWAFKELGCEAILATTACGSLREEIKPGDFIFPDQFIDWTKHRALTMFDDQVIHTPMADPFDLKLHARLIASAQSIGLKFHDHGTIITIEGPRFSTRAESHMFQSLGADIINMSTVPEIILANELKIPYAAVAMATDYDCWKPNEAPVTWELIVDRMKLNSANATKLIGQVILGL
ncbi:TPA: S-methyl-5'-thioadenosine phosphorylase [Candidatus Falkowbacteria bacterium]|nr:S-methyl-5'-thioadenosine phosphorylase [Candidatus Falkowbacteria bacterium]